MEGWVTECKDSNAFIVMADIVMADEVMALQGAKTSMPYIVVGLYSYGRYSYGPM